MFLLFLVVIPEGDLRLAFFSPFPKMSSRPKTAHFAAAVERPPHFAFVFCSCSLHLLLYCSLHLHLRYLLQLQVRVCTGVCLLQLQFASACSLHLHLRRHLLVPPHLAAELFCHCPWVTQGFSLGFPSQSREKGASAPGVCLLPPKNKSQKRGKKSAPKKRSAKNRAGGHNHHVMTTKTTQKTTTFSAAPLKTRQKSGKSPKNRSITKPKKNYREAFCAETGSASNRSTNAVTSRTKASCAGGFAGPANPA